MRTFLLSLLGLCAASAAVAQSAPRRIGVDEDEAPTLVYADIVSSSAAWDKPNTGLVTFPLDATSLSVTRLTPSYPICQVKGGATFTDEHTFYGVSDESWSFYFNKWEETDGTWSRTKYKYQNMTWANVATDMAYDAVNDVVYGVYKNDEAGTSYYLGTFNRDDASITRVADLEQPLVVLAASPSGDLFGISAAGDLYRVSAATAAETLVGATGYKPKAGERQTGAIDGRTGSLYWAAYTDADKSLFLRVSTATGSAELVYEFPTKERMTGMWIPAPAIPMGAPKDVSDFLAETDGTSLSLHVSFTAPTESRDGATLRGTLTYTVTLDGTVAEEGQIAPGAAFAKDFEAAQGAHTVAVATRNSEGTSGEKTQTIFVGPDVPGAPVSLAVVSDGQTMHLTWQAPEAGANGGIYDASLVTYNVVRHPDEVAVATGLAATAYDDLLPQATLANYSYTVELVYGDDPCGAVTSPLVMGGDPLPTPYFEDFDAAASLSDILYGQDNSGNTNTQWTLKAQGEGQAVRIAGANYAGPKNWLFTPPVALTAGKTYTLSFKYLTEDSYMLEQLRVALTASQSAASEVMEVMPQTGLTSDSRTEFSEKTLTFVAPEGYNALCLAFYCATNGYFGGLNIDDISLAPDVETPVTSLSGHALTLSASNGALHIAGAQGEQVVVSDMAGRTIFKGRVSGERTIRVPRGVVVVTAAGHSTRVMN